MRRQARAAPVRCRPGPGSRPPHRPDLHMTDPMPQWMVRVYWETPDTLDDEAVSAVLQHLQGHSAVISRHPSLRPRGRRDGRAAGERGGAAGAPATPAPRHPAPVTAAGPPTVPAAWG